MDFCSQVKRIALTNLSAYRVRSSALRCQFLSERLQVMKRAANNGGPWQTRSPRPPQCRLQQLILVGIRKARSNLLKLILLLCYTVGYLLGVRSSCNLACLRWAGFAFGLIQSHDQPQIISPGNVSIRSGR